MTIRRLIGLLLACVILGSCVPAIIGVSAAAGGLAVGATYEIKSQDNCDGGAKK